MIRGISGCVYVQYVGPFNFSITPHLIFDDFTLLTHCWGSFVKFLNDLRKAESNRAIHNRQGAGTALAGVLPRTQASVVSSVVTSVMKLCGWVVSEEKKVASSRNTEQAGTCFEQAQDLCNKYTFPTQISCDVHSQADMPHNSLQCSHQLLYSPPQQLSQPTGSGVVSTPTVWGCTIHCIYKYTHIISPLASVISKLQRIAIHSWKKSDFVCPLLYNQIQNLEIVTFNHF